MDVYQATIICAECKQSNKVIVTREVSSAECESCSANLMRLRRFDGVIYILKNVHVKGVKIGMTCHDVFRRAKAVSGTGVPGDFEVIAAFPSNNAARDERKIHDRLGKSKIKKRHFDLDPVTAVVKVRTILGHKDWVYLKKKLRAEVEALIDDRRQKTATRLGPKVAKLPMQVDLFSGETAIDKTATDIEKHKHGGGFLANLF